MTDLQFRVLLGIFVLVLTAHIAYNPNREASAKRLVWIMSLSRHQLYLVFAALLVIVGTGIAGLIGMFFFARWGAVLFMVAATVAELVRPRKQNIVEKVLAYSVIGGGILLLYLAFFGPAEALFQ